MISIAQCLEKMHAGAVFSLRVVSYDRRRKDRTGQVQVYHEAVLVWGDGGKDRTLPQGEREQTLLERSLIGAAEQPDWKRDPNHATHYTRNIRVLVDGQPTEAIKKIHPALIIEFNGLTTTP